MWWYCKGCQTRRTLMNFHSEAWLLGIIDIGAHRGRQVRPMSPWAIGSDTSLREGAHRLQVSLIVYHRLSSLLSHLSLSHYRPTNCPPRMCLITRVLSSQTMVLFSLADGANYCWQVPWTLLLRWMDDSNLCLLVTLLDRVRCSPWLVLSQLTSLRALPQTSIRPSFVYLILW